MFNKFIELTLITFFLIFIGNIGVSIAGDNPSDAPITTNSMPPLDSDEYGTDIDNEDNTLSGSPDGDMDVYLFNDNPVHPIEFNIFIEDGVDPRGKLATLRMDVFDIDTPGEIDLVYLNGRYLGTLNGSNNTWGVNVFSIPRYALVPGKNLVQVFVDVTHVHVWAAEIDWGIIKLQDVLAIPKAWIAPVTVSEGDPVNFFAEVTGNPLAVWAFFGTAPIAQLSDPDRDRIWSGAYFTTRPGHNFQYIIVAWDGTDIAFWPGINVLP